MIWLVTIETPTRTLPQWGCPCASRDEALDVVAAMERDLPGVAVRVVRWRWLWRRVVVEG